MSPLTITLTDLLEDFLFPVPATKLYSVRDPGPQRGYTPTRGHNKDPIDLQATTDT